VSTQILVADHFYFHMSFVHFFSSEKAIRYLKSIGLTSIKFTIL